MRVADRNDARIRVEACIADLDNDASWILHDQQADATARIVDPARTFVDFHEPVFSGDLLKETSTRRPTYVWIAEIDLLLSPAVPRVYIGRQQVVLNARANYVFDHNGAPPAKKSVVDLRPIKEFDTGVLFVHGIGEQRRAETLSQWSAPLLRWINLWLGGVTDDLARTLGKEPLEGWLHSLVVRSGLGDFDPDYVDRARYANALVDKARAVTAENWSEEFKRLNERAESTSEKRAPTSAEHAERDKVARIVKQDLHACAVGGGAEFREVYVSDVGARSVEPSSVEMHVQAMAGDGYMLRSRWMMAELHWGDSFWAPSFFSFARWCLLTAPILLVHYVAMARLRRAKSFFPLVPRGVGNCDVHHAGAARVRVADGRTLSSAAILDRVQRDLQWLLKRCGSVVVIAHSQGAAVAESVLSMLEQSATDAVSSFVTLGSGVPTLTAIRQLSKSPVIAFHGWAAIGCIVALGVAVVVALTGAWPLAAAIGAVALAGLLLMATRAANFHQGRRKILPRAGRFRQWYDFFATKDHLPYGPLVNPEDIGRVAGHELDRDLYAAGRGGARGDDLFCVADRAMGDGCLYAGCGNCVHQARAPHPCAARKRQLGRCAVTPSSNK